jgi:hypothetical protein
MSSVSDTEEVTAGEHAAEMDLSTNLGATAEVLPAQQPPSRCTTPGAWSHTVFIYFFLSQIDTSFAVLHREHAR